VIVVTGARGNVGRELVSQLAAAGQPVRAIVRRSEDGASLPPGAEAFVGDLNKPETLGEALDGASGIHLLAGYEGLTQLLADARAAGVRHVVLQSSSAAPTGDLDNAVAAYHIRSEQAVRESGLGWTFLQPNSFMTNTLEWMPQLRAGDEVTAAFPDVAISTIDPVDVAAVSAAALTDSDAHAGQSYRLSGPEALKPADRARILGQVLSREIRFVGLSNEEARAQMSASMPEPYVNAFFSFFVDGTVDETTVQPAVERVLGRPPRSFAQWAEAHADAFSP
jgi:uncharacterized protein YbjT (DUF2867 family)